MDALGLTDAMFTSGQTGDHYRIEGVNMADNSVVADGTVLFTLTSNIPLSGMSMDTFHANAYLDIFPAGLVAQSVLDLNGQICCNGSIPCDDVPVPPCFEERNITGPGEIIVERCCKLYAKVEFTSVASSGSLSITVHRDEFHPAGAGDSVKRWFEITSTVSGTYNLTLAYDENELGTEIENDLCLWRYDGGWHGPYIGTVNTGSNTVTVNDLNTFSDWIIADEQNPMQPPVPEVITIFLISLGLLTLAGYFWYRRYCSGWELNICGTR